MVFRRRVALGAALALALSGCGDVPRTASPGTIATGDPAPTSSDPVPLPPGHVAIVAQSDGVIVTLSASSDRALAGELIQVRADVLNASPTKATWSSGCGLKSYLGFDGPPVAQPPQGRAWGGVAGLVKSSATSEALFLDWARGPDAPAGTSFICPLVMSSEDLAPGQSISAETLWSGLLSDGTPATPGGYQLTFTFPYERAPLGGQPGLEPLPAVKIEAALPIVLGGAPFAGLPSTLAVDAALADPRVSAWMGKHLPVQRFQGAEIRLLDGRYRLTIRLAGDRSTVVFIDPATGRVLDVRLAD